MSCTLAPMDLSVLDQPYLLNAEQIARYRSQGFIKLPGVLPADLLEHFRNQITRRVLELNELKNLDWEKRDTYQKAFIQVMNLWRQDEAIRQFVFSRRMAGIAGELMGAPGVRLYHDQALYKEPSRGSAGHTPWHADQYYWPIDTPLTTTAWIPLHAVPLEMGPLAFAPFSQNLVQGRNLNISDDSEKNIADLLRQTGHETSETPFAAGEVSFHAGWTYHRAGANRTDRPREVMTMIYLSSDARVTQPRNPHQENDLKTWMPGLKPGDPAASLINPLLWESASPGRS